MSIISAVQSTYKDRQNEEFSLEQYLDHCKTDPLFYATAAERLLKAIGEPKYVDTSKVDRLSRIFMNKTIAVYESFKNFFGMEDVIENIVSYLRAAAQGLEESSRLFICLDQSAAPNLPLLSK